MASMITGDPDPNDGLSERPPRFNESIALMRRLWIERGQAGGRGAARRAASEPIIWNPDAHPPIIGRMGQTLPYEFGNVQYAV